MSSKKNGRETKARPWTANEQIAVAVDRAKIGLRNRSIGSTGGRRIRLSADQSRAKQHGGGKFNRYKQRPLVVGRASDPQNEKAETARHHQCTRKIETMRCSRGTRQYLKNGQDRNDAEGDVDGEQPAPRSNREDGRSDRRAEREGGRDHHRVASETQTLQAPWINEANQRRIHTHNTTGAEALQHARRQQAGQRPRTRAE